MKKKFSSLINWFFGQHPQGIGTLLVGIAAIIALCQTSSTLNQILRIQKQARQIKSAVNELKVQSKQIADAIGLLENQLKELKATQTIASSPKLMSPSPTKEQIQEAIQNTILTTPLKEQPSIYLPKDKLGQTVELIYQSKTPAQRIAILQKSLKYQPRKVLADEKGNSIMTEEGDEIILED